MPDFEDISRSYRLPEHDRSHHAEKTKKMTPQQQKMHEVLHLINREPTRREPIRNRALPHNKPLQRPSSHQASAQKNALYNALGIYLLPSRFHKEEYALKQQFLDMHIRPEAMGRVLEQERAHPIMRMSISLLRDGFADWNTRSTSKRKQLSCQLKNLNQLSRVIDVVKNPNQEYLGQKDADFLKPFLTGHKEFTNGDLHTVIKILERPANAEVRPPFDPSKKPSKPLIRAQARLFKKEREALKIAGQKPALIDQNISNNQVTFLEAPSGEIVAVYKEGSGGLEACGIMEELIWEIGQITGDEELLTATKRSLVRTEGEIKKDAGQEKGIDWSSGEFRADLGQARRGGIQPFEGEITLAKWNKAPDPKVSLDRSSMLQLAHFSRLMGTFDLHSSNILVTPEGKFKLFDNTRSLPHSNEAFYSLNDLRVPTRFAFFGADVAEAPLTPAEREQLKNEIAEDRKKLIKIKQFLTARTTRSKLAKLPEGWFHTELALDAMEKRIQWMEEALNNPNVQNISDFILFSTPNSKFMAACISINKHLDKLKELHHGMPDAYQKEKSTILKLVGYDPLSTLINQITDLGFDPFVIHQIAEDPNISFDDMMEKIAEYVVNTLPSEPGKYENHATKLKYEFISKAQPDCKDLSVEDSKDNIWWYQEESGNWYQKLLDDFGEEVKRLNIPAINEDDDTILQFEPEPYPVYTIAYQDDGSAILYYKDIDGQSMCTDINFASRELYVEGFDLKPGDTLAELKKKIIPDFFWNTNQKVAEAVLKTRDHRWLLRTHEFMPKSLVLTMNDRGVIFNSILDPAEPIAGEPQQFFAWLPSGPIQATLSEIEEILNQKGFQPISEDLLIENNNTIQTLKDSIFGMGCPIFHESKKNFFDEASAPYYCVMYDNAIPPVATLYYKGVFGNEKQAPVNYLDDPNQITVSNVPFDLFISSCAPVHYYPIMEFEEAEKLLEHDLQGYLLGSDESGNLSYYYYDSSGLFKVSLPKVDSNPDRFETILPDGSTEIMSITDLFTHMLNEGFHFHMH